MSDRDKNVYFAKLAEQAERYDEMAEHMEKVGKTGDEPPTHALTNGSVPPPAERVPRSLVR